MFYRLSSIIFMIATRVPISSASSVSALITFVNSFIFLTISLPPFYIYIISRMRDMVNTFHKLFLIFSKKDAPGGHLLEYINLLITFRKLLISILFSVEGNLRFFCNLAPKFIQPIGFTMIG